ncbi:glycoside hydrolase, partial [bacterium]
MNKRILSTGVVALAWAVAPALTTTEKNLAIDSYNNKFYV